MAVFSLSHLAPQLSQALLLLLQLCLFLLQSLLLDQALRAQPPQLPGHGGQLLPSEAQVLCWTKVRWPVDSPTADKPWLRNSVHLE